MPNYLRFACLLVALISLNGCTVLGMVADSQLSSQQRQTVIDKQSGLPRTVEPPSVFTELGVAADALVIDGVKKLAADEKPKEVCKHNGHFTECRPVGKQASDLRD